MKTSDETLKQMPAWTGHNNNIHKSVDIRIRQITQNIKLKNQQHTGNIQ